MTKMQSFRRLGRKVQQGFTLVELAIVLAVIGLIIGAVAIAKDVQRNAEYQKAVNKFAYQWKMAYDQYYQRTGVVLGDCQQAPTYMVDGSETTITGGGGGAGTNACTRAGSMSVPGIPASFAGRGSKICAGQGYAADTVGAGDATLATLNLRDLMTRAGVRMPPGRGEGHEDRFLYIDSNGNPAELQVCFQFNVSGTASGAGNVMVIRGLTPDLARFMDQVIDGKPDSREGRFRIQGRPAHANGGINQANAPGTQWEANNTQGDSLGAGTGATAMTNNDARSAIVNNPNNSNGGTTAGRTLDEDQVILLTAHWIMEQ